MANIDFSKHTGDLIDKADIRAGQLNDIALDALYEKDFVTFFQIVDEKNTVKNDALGVCNLYRRSDTTVECKQAVNDMHDEHERGFIAVLNEMCGR